MEEQMKRKLFLILLVAIMIMASYVLGYLMHGETICNELNNLTIIP